MKILMLIDRLGVGGAESHVITLTHALVERGHKVHIFAERGAWTKKAEAAGAICLFPPAKLTGKGFAVTALSTARHLRRLVYHGGYDVLHAHTRRTAFLLRLVGKPLCCARVVTCHAKFAPRYRRICYWGEGCIAVSEDLKTHLTEAFSLPLRRIRVIPNGMDTEHFSPVGRTASPATLRLTFASRLDEDCSAAARLILSLCKKWRDVLLARGMRLSVTIVGGGEAYGALCREAADINERAGEELVHMVGAVDDPAPIFRETDLFVGVSRAALEALFCGASVLLAGDEGMAGLLTPDNFDRLAKGNLCCRGEGALTREGLNAAFLTFLKLSEEEQGARSAQLRAIAAEPLGAACMGRDTEWVYRHLMHASRLRTWLIAGYAGCGNLGDDAIARRLIARMKATDSATRISLTVASPSDPHHRFPGATLIDRRSPLSLIRAVRRSDALLLGGGCLLQNCSVHGNRSLAYYLSLTWLARLFKRPVWLVAAGIGPLRGRLARYMVGRTLCRAAYLSVRDGASRRLAISLGVPPARIHREADPVLSLAPASKEAGKAFLERHLPAGARGKRYLCIAPRAGCIDEQALALALRHLHLKEGIYPLFFAFDHQEDASICEGLIASCGIGCRFPTDDEALVAALFSLDEVVGVAAGRLHALILSQVGGKAGVALIGNGCDSKVAGFAGSVGFGMLPAQATARQILTALRGLFNHRDE